MTSIKIDFSNLPVQSVLGDLQTAFHHHRLVLLRAPPGAGKTTVVPLALLERPDRRGKIMLTQPRRLAARAAAARLATLHGSALGQAIGYQVRQEKLHGKTTQILAVTTGILLRRLLSDPFLEDFEYIVLDEFHERSLELDLALGLLLRLQQTVRPDLKLLIMSATIDCGPLREFLPESVIIESPGRAFDVSIRYARQFTQDRIEQQVLEVLPKALESTSGHLLVFLPGVGEIFRTHRCLEPLARQQGCQLWHLFGEMPSAEQDQVLASTDRRKIILSTNVAETSLTIDGVSGVIDSGLVRTVRYDPSVGLSRLVLEPNSLASANQRAGRAGRQGPGVCFRLWPENMNRTRAPFDTPEILRGDLSGAVLQLAGMSETDLQEFPWLTPPRPEALETAQALLDALGALEKGRLTEEGKCLLSLPTAPRLAKLLWSAGRYGQASSGAIAAALLSERDPFRVQRVPGVSQRPVERSTIRSDSDLVDRVRRVENALQGQADPDLHRGALQSLARAADYLVQALGEIADADAPSRETGETSCQKSSANSDQLLRRAICEAYPDRVARRRQLGSDRGLMVGGIGVKLATSSNVRDAEYFVCVDVEKKPGDAEVRLASAIDVAWLPEEKMKEQIDYFFHPTLRTVQARRRRYWMDLILSEVPITASDAPRIAELLLEQVIASWPQTFPADDPAVSGLLSRMRFLAESRPEDGWPEISEEILQQIAGNLVHGCRSLTEVRQGPWSDHLLGLLEPEQIRKLNEWAPQHWTAPSGNRVAIHYEPGRPPKLSVRLQELFGLAETPRLAGGRIPCLLELLGPNYRPQQLTTDLASFWKNTYPTVRKELLRRYPKHHWPENPLQSTATRSGLKRDAR